MESTLREGGREPGLKLIETLYWDGQTFPRARLHMDRLNRSRALLGWSRPGAQHFRVFENPKSDEPLRLRFTIDASGATERACHPVPPSKPEWRVGLAGGHLNSDDPWLGIKSTRRAQHDQARADLAPGLDEALFLNERGEVCEGTITNIFFDRGQGMRTPPLASGLLPGVLRAELNCPEEVLRAEDLPQVRLWVGNALRGLIPAAFTAG